MILFDGAYGTVLRVRTGEPFPADLCVNNPNPVIQLHEEYIAAGAEVIKTNTFMPSPGVDVLNIICSGTELAVDVTENRVLTALSLGPVGSTLNMAENCYREIARGVRSYPLDFILLETFTDHEEARTAVKSFAEYFPLDSIIISHYPGKSDADIESLGKTAEMFPGVIPGINCVLPVRASAVLYSLLVDKCGKRIYFSPNAGLPDSIIPPDEFCEFAMDLHPWMFGGCCGTDPSYIRMVNRLI